MKLGLHVPDFTYPGGPAHLADDLSRIAAAAEDAGFARISVMDHVWQIRVVGPPEHDMLEAYTTSATSLRVPRVLSFLPG